MATVMLIDGNSLTYRAFFALPTDMATASGQVTNAVFGFTSMLINLMKDHEPDHVAVAFDRPEPTFRHEMTPTYKAQRESAPDILRQQMGLVREVLEAMAIPTLETIGFEADDIIATLATQGRDRGDDVIIVTGDRDSYQLVEDRTSRCSTTSVASAITPSTTRRASSNAPVSGRSTMSNTQPCEATTPTTSPASPVWGRRRLRN